MLTKVEIRNRQGSLLVLPFEDVENGYIVSEITGLDPTKATLVSSSVAGMDGARFNSSKREPRNITMKLEMEPDYVSTSVRSLRQRLYSILLPKSEVSLRFYEDLGSYVDIQGVVESFEAPLFTAEPEATLSLMCFDPDFIDPNPFTVNGVTVSGSTETMLDLPYLGSVEAGFVFTMNVDRQVSSFSIDLDTADGESYTLDFTYPMWGGDTIVISTVSGSKGITRTDVYGTTTSAMYGMSPASPWLELKPGTNRVRVSAPEEAIPWNIQYVNRYGGL